MNDLSDHTAGLSFVGLLRHLKAEVRAARAREAAPPRIPDPWEARLADLQGEVRDEVEYIASHAVFDRLEVRRRERTSGAARRLARVMRQLGWQSARFQFAPGSYQRVRGFQRAAQPTLAGC